MMQVEEMPGFVKRHKLIHNKNKSRVEAFAPRSESLALLRPKHLLPLSVRRRYGRRGATNLHNRKSLFVSQTVNN